VAACTPGGDVEYCGGYDCWVPLTHPGARGHSPALSNLQTASLINLALDALGRAGAPGRAVAPRLDLLRSIGVGYALGEQKHRLAARSLPSDGRRAGYAERWSHAARQLGAEAKDLSRGFVELNDGANRVVVWNHWVPLDNVLTLKLTLDKPLVHEILTGAGLPVPEHTLFDADDLGAAVKFLVRQDGPCVVKPVDRQGGTMTTGGIDTLAHLRRARLRARRLSRRLLIERQIPGENYRFLFLDGRLLDVVRRDAPRVVGDGSSSIRKLIAAENHRRYTSAGGARTWELVADLDTVLTLERRGLTLSSVPAPGESVVVKTVINSNGREFNESVRNEVSGALVAEAARAAGLLGVRLAGVDLITPDSSQSLSTAGGVVLEVNATPGLHYHYDVRNPDRAVAVMVPILQVLFEEAARAHTSEGAPDAPLVRVAYE
jgi:D-alanine-D-alanine ligase-like ATP-grasp enzyme